MDRQSLLCRGFVIALLLMLWSVLSSAEENILSLDDAYRLALQSHENILTANIEIDKSKLIYKKTLSAIYPHLSASIDYSKPKEAILLDSSPVIPAEK